MNLDASDYENWLTAHLAQQQHRVDRPLYHYTNAGGAIGMLDSGDVWFTSAYHVNDPSEERFGIKIAKEILGGLVLQNPAHRSYRDAVFDRLDSQDFRIHFEPFVACFSEDRDTLEQWRPYGDNGRGICIGFNPSLFSVEPKPKIKGGVHWIVKVVYGDEAIPLMKEPIEKWYGMLPPGDLSPPERYEWLTKLTVTIMWYSLRVKHDAYKAEKEVRLFTRSGGTDKLGLQLKFRARGSSIVPYISMNISANKAEHIRELIAGPAADANSLDALHSMKATRGWNDTHISQSKIPYRA